MKKLQFLFLLLTGTGSFGQAQTAPNTAETARSSAIHAKNTWMVGGGITFVGLTAKAGRFVANRWWVGGEAEIHNLFSNRKEVGVFTRYHIPWNRSLSSFIGTGLSYGSFQAWDWDFDNEIPGEPERYRTAKLNLMGGLEVHLSEKVSLEAVAKVGKLTNTSWVQPSFQLSANVYLGKKAGR